MIYVILEVQALGNAYKIAVQEIQKVTSSSLRALPNPVRWYFE